MNKTVFITGATRGLGAHLARQFASRGYKLALTGRKPDELEALRLELQPVCPEICVKALDVVNFDAIEVTMRECARELGGIDIVIANAGVAYMGRIGQGGFEDMRKTIDVNLTGAIATCESAVALFREQGRGQIVGISSVSAVRGMRNQGAYSATKAGFSKYLESMHCETADEPIVVTELAPGYIDTDINQSLASRPFLVSAEKGTKIMADLIERQVRFRYVPPWPWSLVAQFLKILPIGLLKKM